LDEADVRVAAVALPQLHDVRVVHVEHDLDLLLEPFPVLLRERLAVDELGGPPVFLLAVRRELHRRERAAAEGLAQLVVVDDLAGRELRVDLGLGHPSCP